MIIKYSPEDGEPKEFEFLPTKLLSPEAEAIESVGGNSWDTFEEFGFKFLKGGIRAYRAALWIMLKRENPRLKFNDVEFTLDQVSVDYSRSELTKIKESLENDDEDIPDDQRKAALSNINSAIESKEAEGIPADLKEPSEKSEATHSTSVPLDSHQV